MIAIFFLFQISCFNVYPSFTLFQEQVDKLSMLRLVAAILKSAQKYKRHFIVLKHFRGGLRNHTSPLQISENSSVR